jgi:hypothetical protein
MLSFLAVSPVPRVAVSLFRRVSVSPYLRVEKWPTPQR